MNNYTIAELGVFIGVLGGVATSLILTIQKSRCQTIDCCGIKCKRELKKTSGEVVIPPPETPEAP